MTFRELEDWLPNGFHDSEILTLQVDFVARSIEMRMSLHVGSDEEPEPERYRVGTIRVSSLCVFFLEAPDPSYQVVLDGTPLNASGDVVPVGASTAVDELRHGLPLGVEPYRFFLDDWNTFLYLAGSDVEFTWLNPPSELGKTR